MDLLNQLYAFLGFVTTMWQMENIKIFFFFFLGLMNVKQYKLRVKLLFLQKIER